MRFIAIISVCLGLTSSCLAAPSQLPNFQQESASQFSFGFKEQMAAPLDGNSEALQNERSEIKERSQPNFNQQLENITKESLRTSDSTTSSQIAPMAIGRSFHFPELGIVPIKYFNDDFNILSMPKENANVLLSLKDDPQLSAIVKGDANFLPKGDFAAIPLPNGEANIFAIPKGDLNILPLKGNAEFLTKTVANSQPLSQSEVNFLPLLQGNPDSLFKGDTNIRPLLKESSDFLSVPRGDANSLPSPKDNANLSPFSTGNTDSPSLPKGDANPLSLPKGNFPPFTTANADFLLLKNGDNILSLPNNANLKTAPAAPSQDSQGAVPERLNSVPLPEQVKDTPEVAAAREAHLRAVAEAAAKLAESVKDTPEVIAAREAHLRAAANPKVAMSTEAPKYTPEVQAAREAHFRAYALAAKLAAESDINPKILEQLLGRPGEPKLSAQKIDEKFESLMSSPKFAEEVKQLIEMLNLPMNIQVPATKPEMPKESLPQPTDSKGINNLMEKTQLKAPMKSTEIIRGTGASQPSASLRIPDAKLSSLDEFKQSEIKAANDLICSTDLKVKDLNNIRPTEDRRFIIIRTGELTPITSTLLLPVNQSGRWKNWAIQYTSL